MGEETYIRFVVGTESDNQYELTGIFTVCRELRDDGKLQDHEKEHLEDVYKWFEDNLPCPPFEASIKSGTWTRDAVAWFKDKAGEPLKRMWDMVAILKEHDVPVRFIRSKRPGRVVYEDQYQVVAESPK